MPKKSVRLSPISTLHYTKLILRSLLFLAVLVFYILDKADVLANFIPLPIGVWVLFVVEMILRFFPARLESMGCQKQFRRNYIPVSPNAQPTNQSWRTTALVAVAWLALNGLIGLCYYLGWFDRGILLLIAIGFSVCDIICILFFCPFQTWFMKNRCCTTCRIYNWDFAMMFTPLVFIPSLYTYSLLGFALALLIRWEVTYKLHPERFSPATNRCLSCANCEEKLCS
ncbi:MAG: hypothetical protein IKZ21_00565, partial [Clostridia bacterium]|nr:hypothetical protein [Clostridia bacterium]